MSNVESIFPSNNFDHVISKAKGVYDSALIIGYNHNGCLEIRGGGMVNGKQPVAKDWLFMIETFKFKLINGDYS